MEGKKDANAVHAASLARLEQLQEEKSRLDPESFPVISDICDKEIERIQSGQEFDKFIEIHDSNPTKVSFRVRLPVKEYPQSNFVGRIVGQGGATIKQLQEQSGCRIAVFGRGSIKDKAKEEELRLQGGKYAHLNQDLHVSIDAHGPPVSCYQRIAQAIALVAPLLAPDFQEGQGPNSAPQNGGMFRGMPQRGMPPAMMRRPFRGGPLMGMRGAGGGRGAPPAPMRGQPGGRGGRGQPPMAPPAARGAFRGRGGAPPRGGQPPTPRGSAPGRVAAGARGGPAGRSRGGGIRGAPGAAGRGGGGWASAAADSTSFQTDSYGYDSSSGQEATYEGENYDQSGYSAAAENDSYSYDYGHGDESQAYDSYGASAWTEEGMEPSGYGKTSAARLLGAYRSRPY